MVAVNSFGQRSSGVEQRFCKPSVGGPNPSAGSMGRWQSGQMHQTVNLASSDFGGSNPSLPTRFLSKTCFSCKNQRLVG